MARRKNSPRQPLGDGAGNHGLPELAPDLVEQEGGHFDGAVPTSGVTLPVVGLGGSAGGLPALQAFFTTMPADNGMAFVVIMHLSPEHESMLAEVLQKTTAMPVRQVRGRVKVEPNHVYVIPPARNLSMEDGHLILIEPGRRLGKHVAVDLFFRTLADTHGLLAAAIVLSGADGDGAIGIKRIKERGGLAVAQKPSQAEHDSMPRAAIATNMVDWVLPVEEMPARLLEYWRAGRRLHLPQENEGVSTPEAPGAAPGHHDGTLVDDEAALRDVLIVLRARTGHDFSYYKRATILRRVGRRLQVNGIADMPAYLEFLRTSADEAGALLQDLLISVTNFFRDRDAFTALATMVPALFRGKGPQDTVRVWVAACATGEEAYSMAMLLCEHAMTLEAPPKLQVFATDLHEHAIHAARGGFYPGTISADVTEERLRRFFSTEHGGYRINREVREMVLFALHDVLKDPPFSRLDLISCRNLLIYLNRDAQARALGIFHFALLPEGTLFLGSSGIGGRRQPAFRGGRQEAAPLRPSGDGASRFAAADGAHHAATRTCERGRERFLNGGGSSNPERRAVATGQPARDRGCTRLPGRDALRVHRAACAAFGDREPRSLGAARVRARRTVSTGGRRRAEREPAPTGASDAQDRVAGRASPGRAERGVGGVARRAGRDRRGEPGGDPAGRALTFDLVGSPAGDFPGGKTRVGRVPRTGRTGRRVRVGRTAPGAGVGTLEGATARHRRAGRRLRRGAKSFQRRVAGHERGVALRLARNWRRAARNSSPSTRS